MYRSIMAPLDGSAFGEYALPLALGIARRACATVHLVHVRMVLEPNPSAAEKAQIAADHERMVHYLDDLAADLSERWEVIIKPVILDGPLSNSLHTYAQENAIDLTVMSTHGYGPLSRIWLGSIANTFVQQLTMPILLTRPHGEAVDLLETVHDKVFEHLLIPLDGSAVAESILEPAMTLGALMGAKYTLLRAIEPFMKGYIPTTYATRVDEELREPWRDEAQCYLDQIAERVRASGSQVETVVSIAHAPEAILTYTGQHTVDLITLTTHGRTGLARVLMGSVADTIVSQTSVPILLYRSPLKQQEKSKTAEDHATIETS